MATKNTTTKKDLFARIAATMADDHEVVEMCEKYIKQLSTRKVSKAVLEFTANVGEFLAKAEGPMTCSEIAMAMGITPQKIAPAMKKLREAGDVTMIPGERKKDPATYVWGPAPEIADGE